MFDNMPERYLAPLTSPQIRDFGNRVLLSLAERHTTDSSWTNVGTDRIVDNSVDRRGLHFEANWRAETEMYDYHVSISQVIPFDSEWSEEGKLSALNLTFEQDTTSEFSNNDNSGDSLVADSAETESVDTEIEQPEGYLSMDHEYRFYVPFGNVLADAIKTVTFSIYDEDRDPIDTEVVSHHSAYFDDPVRVSEVEDLVRFGEIVIDANRLEKSLSEVTVGDLSFILDTFKTLSLIRSDCKVLSSRVS